jgi:hypothetical protein
MAITSIFSIRLEMRADIEGLGHQFRGVAGDHWDGGWIGCHRDQARAGAQRSHAGHGGGAGLAARSGDDQHVAECAFVSIPRARRKQRGEHGRLDHGQPDGLVRIVKRGRAADGRDVQFAHGIAIGRQHMGGLWRREGDGVMGACLLARRLAGIAGHARGKIDRHHFGERKAAVDFADGVEHRAGGRTVDAGAQQSIDHDGGQLRFRGYGARHRAAADFEHAIVQGCVAA